MQCLFGDAGQVLGKNALVKEARRGRFGFIGNFDSPHANIPRILADRKLTDRPYRDFKQVPITSVKHAESSGADEDAAMRRVFSSTASVNPARPSQKYTSVEYDQRIELTGYRVNRLFEGARTNEGADQDENDSAR